MLERPGGLGLPFGLDPGEMRGETPRGDSYLWVFIVKLTTEAKPAAHPTPEHCQQSDDTSQQRALEPRQDFFLILQLILHPFALTNKLLPLKDSDLNNCLVAWPWALLHSNHVIMPAEKACAALQFTLSLFKPIRNNFKGTGDKILQQKEVCTRLVRLQQQPGSGFPVRMLKCNQHSS